MFIYTSRFIKRKVNEGLFRIITTMIENSFSFLYISLHINIFLVIIMVVMMMLLVMMMISIVVEFATLCKKYFLCIITLNRR